MTRKKASNGNKPMRMDNFSEINKLIARFLEDVAKDFSEFTNTEAMNGPLVYGFNMRIGSNGEPVIGNFGNVKPTEPKVKFSEEREPLIDILEDDDKVTIIAEMPGIDKNEIQITALPTDLFIEGKGRTRNYSKRVRLNVPITQEPVSTRFHNGVLEVLFKKTRTVGRQPKPNIIRISD